MSDLIRTTIAYIVLKDNEFMGIFTDLQDARNLRNREEKMTHASIWIEERTLIV